jgi:putative hemolysin
LAIYISLLVVLLFLSAFFSSSETAYLTLERVRLAHLVHERVPGAARVSALLDRPRRLLSAILLGNNLVNTAAASVATAFVAEVVTGGGVGVVISTISVTILLLLFGEIGPKSIALSRAFALSRLWSLPMMAWVRLTTPFTIALDAASDALIRRLGGEDTRTTLSAAELRTAIRMGAAAGSLEKGGASHLLGALTLQHRQVEEIMVPRVDIVSAAADAPIREVARLLAEAGYLRIPLYEETPDELVGFVHVSDVNAARIRGRDDRPAREIMRPARYQSERASVAKVLRMMQEEAVYLVLLVDEFGVISGMVTLEDILEEVVGVLRSESGFEAAEEHPSAAERRVVDGSTHLTDLSHDLDVDVTKVDANTVAGLILFHIGHFPQPGEWVDHAGFRFTVVESDARRITSVAVERAPEGEGQG